MYHREGKKCDFEKEREREREREEEQSVPSFREREKNAKIIGSCEYLIGDPSISISIPKVFLRLHLFTPLLPKKETKKKKKKRAKKLE